MLQLTQSVNGLPLRERGTSMLCGVKMRPSSLRKLCEGAGSIWHFNAEGQFGKIGFNRQRITGEIQCGELDIDYCT